MQSKADRDGAIDEMLGKILRAEAARATVSEECLDAETIAAWNEGSLPSASARIETHLSQCSRCQALLATLVRSTPPTPAPSRSIWQRWQLRWLVPIAAAASALALWIAIPADRRDAAPPRPVLDDARQSVPSSPAPPSAVAGQERNDVRALEKRADQSQRPAAKPEAPSSVADNAAAPPAPSSRDRSAFSAASPQEADAGPPPAPAAPPPPRRELSAERQTQAAIEAVSPDLAIRWRIVNRTRIERSTDSGASWQAVVFPEATDPIAIRALSATGAIVTTADNRQFRTDDAGKTWSIVAP